MQIPLQRCARLVLCVALALPTIDLIRLHPYEMTYFNRFVGGLDGAYGRYETDYWLLSYREGMEWINARAQERKKGDLNLLVAADSTNFECAAHFAGPRVWIEPRLSPDPAPQSR